MGATKVAVRRYRFRIEGDRYIQFFLVSSIMAP